MPVGAGFLSPVSITRTTCASSTSTPCPRFQSPHAARASAASATTRMNRGAADAGITWAERYRFDPACLATHDGEWAVLMRHNVYVAAIVAITLVACGGLTGGSPQAPTLPAGTYRGVGTGAGLESLTALATRFQAKHAGVTFKLEDVGADTSIALVGNGDADFGFLSRDLKPEETSRVRSIPYAGTGTGLAVNTLNAIGALTAEQVRKIYTGA